MENIITDLDFLYEYFADELRKRNINLLNKRETNIVSINKWLNSLKETEKVELIKLVKQTINSYNEKKNAAQRKMSLNLVYLQILMAIIIISLIVLLLFRIGAYLDLNPREREPIEKFLSFLIVVINVVVLIIQTLQRNIKDAKRNKEKLKSLTEKIKRSLNNFNLKLVNVQNLADSFDDSIINFMKSYDEQVSIVKFGDFIRFTLIDEISYFFNEQKTIIYKDITQNLTNSSNSYENFVNYIFSKQLILNDINSINHNIKIYEKINDKLLIPDQNKLVNKFIDDLYLTKILNEDKLVSSKIYIILSKKLRFYVKYDQLSINEMLKEIKRKIKTLVDSDKSKILNYDIMYNNYLTLINSLFESINEEEKRDSYMTNRDIIPARFIQLRNFVDMYKKLSVSHLETIVASTNKTISKINQFRQITNMNLEKDFETKKSQNFQFFIINLDYYINKRFTSQKLYIFSSI